MKGLLNIRAWKNDRYATRPSFGLAAGELNKSKK